MPAREPESRIRHRYLRGTVPALQRSKTKVDTTCRHEDLRGRAVLAREGQHAGKPWPAATFAKIANIDSEDSDDDLIGAIIAPPTITTAAALVVDLCDENAQKSTDNIMRMLKPSSSPSSSSSSPRTLGECKPARGLGLSSRAPRLTIFTSPEEPAEDDDEIIPCDLNSKQQDLENYPHDIHFAAPYVKSAPTSGFQTAEERKNARVDRTSVLAAFCPREVLYQFQNNCKRLDQPLVMDAHECVVLWIDICKFTRLAEHLSPKMLGLALTDIFAEMIELVTLHGGDVVKFCGDALLCTFRDAQAKYEDESAGVDAAICAACKCAQAVQSKTFTIQPKAVDPAMSCSLNQDQPIELHVKTCVAQGKIHAMLVGGAYDRWEYLVVGQPLQNLRAADTVCGPGELVITSDVYQRLRDIAGDAVPMQRRSRSSKARADARSQLTPLMTSASDAQSVSALSVPSSAASYFDRTFSFSEMASSSSSSVSADDTFSEDLSPVPSTFNSQFLDERRTMRRAFSLELDSINDVPTDVKPLHDLGLDIDETPTTASRSPRSRAATTLDLPVPSMHAAAGQATRVTPRLRRASRLSRSVTAESLPRWKPLVPSPRSISSTSKPSDLLLRKVGSCDSLPDPERDHYVITGGEEWFANEAPLLPSNAELDLSAIHNAAATKSQSHPSDIKNCDDHPLSAFVPFQVRNRLQTLENCLAPPLCSPRSRTFYSQAFWQDPSFAEMRHVTVLFIKLHGLTDVGYEEEDGLRLAKSIHKSLVVIQGNLYRYGGTLRQMLCDDKGTVAIGVFGVPGSPKPVTLRQDDVSFALVAALEIQQELASRTDLQDCRVSIGVSTGEAFCGIIGSQQRAEYSIVGDTVNTAARIMEFTGPEDSRFAVACDEQTRNGCKDSDIVGFDSRTECVYFKNKAQSIRLFYPRLRLCARPSCSKTLDLLVGQDLAATAIQSLLKSQTLFSHQQINQVMILQGEQGSGKTALLDYAKQQHAKLLTANATSPMLPLPTAPGTPTPPDVRFYSVPCKSNFNPLQSLYAQVLNTASTDWVSQLVDTLKMRASNLLGYIELLAEIFPDQGPEFTKHREEEGYAPLELRPGSLELEGALWAFLARLLQVHHIFRPGVLCIDDLHTAETRIWRWLMVVISSCCLRQIDDAEDQPNIDPVNSDHKLSLPPKINIAARNQPLQLQRQKSEPGERGSTKRKPMLTRNLGLRIDTSLTPVQAFTFDEDHYGDHCALPPPILTSSPVNTQRSRPTLSPSLDVPASQRRRSYAGSPVEVPPRMISSQEFWQLARSEYMLTCNKPQTSRHSKSLRRKRGSELARESGIPAAHGSPRTGWVVLDDSSLNNVVARYCSTFGVFDEGPSTLLSVIMTAPENLSGDFQTRFLSLLKRHQGTGRFSLRIIPLRPLSDEDAQTLTVRRLRQARRNAPPALCKFIAQRSGGNPGQLTALISEFCI